MINLITGSFRQSSKTLTAVGQKSKCNSVGNFNPAVGVFDRRRELSLKIKVHMMLSSLNMNKDTSYSTIIP